MKNYTSEVPVERTISRIEQILAKAGARAIAKSYKDGVVASMSFALPIYGPVWVKVLAYRWTLRKIDLPNILSAVDDMLEACGVLADDALVESHDGSRKFLGIAKDEARTEIEIEEL